MNCPFCNRTIYEINLLYESDNFYIIENNRPIITNHIMLIPRAHIRSEDEIPDGQLEEYQRMNKMAFYHIRQNCQRDPMIFINASQDQSVLHLHKHYMPGFFGVHGVDRAIRSFLPGSIAIDNRR